MTDKFGEILPISEISCEELIVPKLGKATVLSPLASTRHRFIPEEERILVHSEAARASQFLGSESVIPAFEAAGPREQIYFSPAETGCGIVTCGGLCPGLNDVIRSIVMTLRNAYGVDRILGFRFGYAGLSSNSYKDPVYLDLDAVEKIHEQGGTILGTSRGPQEIDEMIETLVHSKIQILFAVGGDGTLRGACKLAEEILRRNLKISVIGVPKTIDNDLMWIVRSFGFATAVEAARTAVAAAHVEAKAAWNGIGLVRLMGRHSGFIAAEASLTNGDVDFCLVPEVPFTLKGKGGFLENLHRRLERHKHAVVVVAEGAGQDLMAEGNGSGSDASGNTRLKDIGLFLKQEIANYFAKSSTEISIKYIDPSYMIRSLPANAFDSGYCMILGQHAVHAGLSGRTNMMVGYWNRRYTHVPLPVVVAGRKRLDPQGEIWQRVLDSTMQPPFMVGVG